MDILQLAWREVVDDSIEQLFQDVQAELIVNQMKMSMCKM